MLNLILKDLLIQKKTLGFLGLYIIIFSIAFQSVGSGAFTGIVIAVTYQLVVTASSLEEKAGSDIILNSLPISRGKIVAAKYLSVILYGLMAVLGYVIYSSILSLVPISVSVPSITPESLAAAFAGIMVMNSIYYPVYFKTGFIRARIISFILFFAFFFGLMTLFEAASGKSSNAIFQAIAEFFNSVDKTQFSLMIIGGVLLFMLASFGLSVKLYKGREF
ncbi:MAG: ABC-2 transporter permease [Clostridiales bacterium]|nr:ABC-2 transporter permease [Clostridiales bacterium]